MKKTIDRKIIVGFVLALTIWLTMGSLLYRNTSEQAQETRWVAHTYEVRAKIQEVLLRLTEAETARRGFVMSGHDRFLKHYSNAVERADAAFRQLRVIIEDNPRQGQACDALQ